MLKIARIGSCLESGLRHERNSILAVLDAANCWTISHIVRKVINAFAPDSWSWPVAKDVSGVVPESFLQARESGII
jgi:hypothetical protein